MSGTPFRDHAMKLARRMDYIAMSVSSDRARSHGWWRNMVEHGAWRGPGSARVGPPDREALAGIAKLFRTSPDEVARMIAADWYGIYPDDEVSARVRRLGPSLDLLEDTDFDLIEKLVARMASPSADQSTGSAA